MRTTAFALGLTLGLAGPSLAQSNRGAFAVDAMVAPTTGLGFGYYVTDGLSLRPWLGLGYSDYQGFFANVGAQLRYEFGTGWTVSPYLSASAQYSHSEPSAIASRARRARAVRRSCSGQRRPVRRRCWTALPRREQPLALRRGSRAARDLPDRASFERGWSSFDINDRTRGEVVLGVSYLFR